MVDLNPLASTPNISVGLVGALVVLVGWLIRREIGAIDKKLSVIRSDDEILGLVNGKYLSRREVDLMNVNSDHVHEVLRQEISSIKNCTSDIAVINTKMNTVQSEVQFLRTTVHEHGGWIAVLLSKLNLGPQKEV